MVIYIFGHKYKILVSNGNLTKDLDLTQKNQSLKNTNVSNPNLKQPPTFYCNSMSIKWL